ncbi:MAG TPA: hypothetical protein ENH10_09560, partial [Bacteroidetes bacterium]|nr:hypothetical protein [Bacteroidota bacterium]HEX05379.1 hypothetical protein [Bacteroidota bacterium]
MKTTLVSLLILTLFVVSPYAKTTENYQEIKAEIEAAYIPNLVIAVADDFADDLRLGNNIPEELSALYPSAVYEPLSTIPISQEHELLWRKHGLHRWFIVRNVPDLNTSRSTLQSLEALESVDIAEFSSLHFADLTPMDDGNYNVWAMDNMQAYEAWDHQVGRDEVVVSTLDTGCELQHPDLQHNIYINPGEDLNSNGFWDATDLNGIDDDGNGYVDDLAGWDFVSSSPANFMRVAGEDYGPRDSRVWPDIVGHGTHTAGTSASSTNNAIGVPSASWNVTNMPLRTGYAIRLLVIILGAGDAVDFVAAIQYAAENGTDIISISFGGTAYEQF